MRTTAYMQLPLRGRFPESRYPRTGMYSATTASHISKASSKAESVASSFDESAIHELVELVVADIVSADYTFSGIPEGPVARFEQLSPGEIMRIGFWLHDEIVADVARRQ